MGYMDEILHVVTILIDRFFRPAAICLAVVRENTDVTQIDLGKMQSSQNIKWKC